MATPIRIFWLPGSSTDPNLPKLQPLGWIDSFDRADSASSLGLTDNGVPWITSGTWGITAGAAYCAAGAGTLWAAAEAFTADGELTVEFGAIEEYAGLAFRVIDTSNQLFVNWQGGALRLYKRVAGTTTQIVSVPGAAPTAGDTLAVTLVGSSIVVKKNSAVVISETVTDLQSATKHGLIAGVAGGAVRYKRADFVAG